MKIVIIGGTDLYETGDHLRSETFSTLYGNLDVEIIHHEKTELAFLNRHSRDHSIPSHSVNYRVNPKALKELGIRHVLASTAVGSCNPEFQTGDLILLKDFIDNTCGRPLTFF